MKKEYIGFKNYCDVCDTEVYHLNICSICGKDLCSKCSRYICEKEEYKEEFQVISIICVGCIDTLKLSLRITAGQEVKDK